MAKNGMARREQPPLCSSEVIHEDSVRAARDHMTTEEEYLSLSSLYKMFGDPTRIRILHALLPGELCVCDLAAALGMTQSAVSHQLRILKQNKLVKSRREGKSIFYSLADGHVRTIIDQGLEHIEEE